MCMSRVRVSWHGKMVSDAGRSASSQSAVLCTQRVRVSTAETTTELLHPAIQARKIHERVQQIPISLTRVHTAHAHALFSAGTRRLQVQRRNPVQRQGQGGQRRQLRV